jgi:hypothetical protein
MAPGTTPPSRYLLPSCFVNTAVGDQSFHLITVRRMHSKSAVATIKAVVNNIP